MVNKHLGGLLFGISTVLGSNAYSQETENTQNKVRNILDSSISISVLRSLPVSDIREIQKQEAPNNLLYFTKKNSENQLLFLGNGCIQQNNAITANHVAEPSDWKPKVVYQNPTTDIFIGETSEFEDVDISSIHGDALNGQEVELTGIRQDEKWFSISGTIEYFYIPKVTVNNLYTGDKSNLSGEFYLMRKTREFNGHTLSGSCVTHNGNVIGVLTGFVSIGKNDFFLISKVTPDLIENN